MNSQSLFSLARWQPSHPRKISLPCYSTYSWRKKDGCRPFTSETLIFVQNLNASRRLPLNDFFIVYKLTNLLVFSLQPINQYSAGVLPPKGSTDYSLIFVKANAEPKTSSDVPFHRTIYRYNKVETTSDLTLPKHLFQLSSKTDLPRQPPPFLSGLSPALKALSLIKIPENAKRPALVHARMCCGHGLR